jgi:hypothetical protein
MLGRGRFRCEYVERWLIEQWLVELVEQRLVEQLVQLVERLDEHGRRGVQVLAADLGVPGIRAAGGRQRQGMHGHDRLG